MGPWITAKLDVSICQNPKVVRGITIGIDYPVYLCYGNVKSFVIFFALYLPSKHPVGSFPRPTGASPQLSVTV